MGYDESRSASGRRQLPSGSQLAEIGTSRRIFHAVAAGCGLVFIALAAFAAPAYGQDAPVVQPIDVSTPTPGPPSFAPLPGAPGPTPVLPAAVSLPDAAGADRTYTVRPGDTLLSVALETGLDLAAVPCAVDADCLRRISPWSSATHSSCLRRT